tara:strand:- start:7327 stop:7455 length:129 start_codon:yes stop_codon:yes gene_type:complete
MIFAPGLKGVKPSAEKIIVGNLGKELTAIRRPWIITLSLVLI